jgi:hypothetical protein
MARSGCSCRCCPIGLKLYFVWAKGTAFFKIGFTKRCVADRVDEIDSYSPLELLIAGVRTAAPGDERRIHAKLRTYRVRGEWFELPEPLVWQLLRHFGASA